MILFDNATSITINNKEVASITIGETILYSTENQNTPSEETWTINFVLYDEESPFVPSDSSDGHIDNFYPKLQGVKIRLSSLNDSSLAYESGVSGSQGGCSIQNVPSGEYSVDYDSRDKVYEIIFLGTDEDYLQNGLNESRVITVGEGLNTSYKIILRQVIPK